MVASQAPLFLTNVEQTPVLTILARVPVCPLGLLLTVPVFVNLREVWAACGGSGA